MFRSFAKNNIWLLTLALNIFFQWCLLLLLLYFSHWAALKFQALQSSLSSSVSFNFWEYIWRSGEVMNTYGNVVKVKNYQDNQIPNLVNILITGNPVSSSPSISVSSFQQFNLAIQLSVAAICIFGFLGVFNLLLILYLCWRYLLLARTWNFKKLALVILLNVIGLFMAYHIESYGHLNLKKSSPLLLNLKCIRKIRQLQKNAPIFHESSSLNHPLIEVKQLNFFHTHKSKFLSKTSESIHILKDINLKIQRGSFTVIIGPNGSGKTTLLKLLINLYSNFSGEILWMGKKLSEVNRSAMAREVSYIPQFLNLQHAISVLDFLEFARYPYRQVFGNSPEIDRKISEKAVERNHCQHLKDRMINELSGGQKQKIILTSVLVQEAEIIVLDEPTSYLDTKNQYQFLNLLSQLHSKGKTIIMILHDLQQSIKYADHLIVLNGGRIMAEGRPSDVVNKDLLREVFKIDCDIDYTPSGIELNNIYAL